MQMYDKLDTGRQAEMMRVAKEYLKDEISHKEAVTKRVDDLADIVDIALTALQDHQPALSSMLMTKAKKIFGEK